MSNLGFYDHHRQSYGALPLDKGLAAQFHVLGDGELDGEFRIEMSWVHRNGIGRDRELMPRIVVFYDAGAVLAAAMAAGLFDALVPVGSADEFAGRLSALGFTDRSDLPVGSPAPTCACCGRTVDRSAFDQQETPA